MHAGRTVLAVNDTQSDKAEHDEPLRMPVRSWSIQWRSIRILWGFAAFGLFARSAGDNTDMAAIGGFAIGAIVFGILTAIAYSDRRRWAREHAEDQPEL